MESHLGDNRGSRVWEVLRGHMQQDGLIRACPAIPWGQRQGTLSISLEPCSPLANMGALRVAREAPPVWCLLPSGTRWRVSWTRTRTRSSRTSNGSSTTGWGHRGHGQWGGSGSPAAASPTPLPSVPSADPVLRAMWPDGDQSITEVTKRPLTAGTLFKNSMVALVENLASKVGHWGCPCAILVCPSMDSMCPHGTGHVPNPSYGGMSSWQLAVVPRHGHQLGMSSMQPRCPRGSLAYPCARQSVPMRARHVPSHPRCPQASQGICRP